MWKSACATEPFSEINNKNLTDELVSEIRRAEVEWKQIDLDLLKWLGAELSAELISARPLIASGYGAFLAVAIVISGAITLGQHN